jgi:hypothetical protein
LSLASACSRSSRSKGFSSTFAAPSFLA